jgi:hypothetical protein
MVYDPTCCSKPTRLSNGAEVYPHRADLHGKAIWICDECGAYVGCHPGTTDALGTLANAELRAARMKLHDRRIDPIWRNAWRDYQNVDAKSRKNITRTARVRVYEFLADSLGLSRDETHTGMFDLEMCRRAWRALDGVTYQQIREWAKARKEAA